MSDTSMPENLSLVRTDSSHPDFIPLVQQLDIYLAEKDGEEHAFYASYNTLDAIRHVIVLYHDDLPVACGAIKQFDSTSMEVKRMYTIPSHRGMGAASSVLNALEQWAKELDYTTVVLETGKRQPEAIALYEKAGYNRIPNYGQYAGMENSVCFEKRLLPI
jgi:putative acetyltransferase